MNDWTQARSAEDLVCYSHLRWAFVYQRPQHLMSRFARDRRVFFIEEPIQEERSRAELRLHTCEKSGVHAVTPLLPQGLQAREARRATAALIRSLFQTHEIRKYIAWYYTPMALDVCAHVAPVATIYDCMDELSLFRGAPPEILQRERKLFRKCDLVFTGGVSLFEAKRNQHASVYPFPSSVDCAHFMQARQMEDTAPDQKDLPHPRLGYAGVIDERIDFELIDNMAAQRPEWQTVIIGPVTKVDPAKLPRRPNIHWLGMKDYAELPRYLAGWDVALMPFMLNEATRYISPTKTPEYLAAGLPVVSTRIRDVERQYGALGLARIADNAEEFLAACDHALTSVRGMKWRERTDAYLQTLSWDNTWTAMRTLIDGVLASRATERGAGVSAMASGVSQAFSL